MVLVAALLAVGLWAISGAGPCSGDAGERDDCHSARLVAQRGDDLPAVEALAAAIQDPFVRSVSMVAWAKVNRGRVSSEDAARVCRFAGQDEGKCRYELQAGHLGTSPSAGPCDTHLGNDVVWTACQVDRVAAATTLAVAEVLARQCGVAEGECRQAWVEKAWTLAQPPTLPEVLAFCSTDACRFRAIDADPPNDILDCIALCTAHTGALGPDCATHAYARWAVLQPAADEVERVRAADSPFPTRLDAALGHQLFCGEPSSGCPRAYGDHCARAQVDAAAKEGFCDEWRLRSRATRDILRIHKPAPRASLPGTPVGPPVR